MRFIIHHLSSYLYNKKGKKSYFENSGRYLKLYMRQHVLFYTFFLKLFQYSVSLCLSILRNLNLQTIFLVRSFRLDIEEWYRIIYVCSHLCMCLSNWTTYMIEGTYISQFSPQ